ncbi:MAG: 4-hydroxy-3-methylbut-2-enyl diphosphate reductase [Clostridia bacterium]|nr:4-hydroxy-3-methylbut-2-enyl diphosphate reductase [Clostridia bacterium]
MNITVAENAGFCFGVRRAADTLEQALRDAKPGERICTLGHLIHNDTYNERMRRRGVQAVEENDLDAIAAAATPEHPACVLIRAHGIPRSTRRKLDACAAQNPSFRYVDCTCPFVTKIHHIATENSPRGEGEETVFLVMGSADHPEVKGFVSCFEGETHVFQSAQELEDALKSGKIVNLHKRVPVFAAQTTFHLCEWKKSIEILKNLCTNAIIFDTICSVTEKRQAEAAALAQTHDLMIVIGGRESSNTRKLYHICREFCPDTIWIESADELKTQNINPFSHRKVGIVAGASTPADVIEEVHKTMSEHAENFAAMLEESLKTLNTGDTVTGYVTAVTDAELQLDLGAKVTGVIKAEQITDDPSVKLTEAFKIGDAVEAFVIRVSDVDGVAELSKKRVDSDKNRQKILAAKDADEVLTGKVIEIVKGGVIVLVDSVKVFVPASQTGVPKSGNMDELKNETVKFKIIEIKDGGKKAVGSIRIVAREERKAREAEFWAAIEEGKHYTGTVKSMTSYGAFVDLGCGVDGMVHMSELSWKHIKSPAEVVSVGDEITVFVKSFDAEKKRISLGYKTEETNPWNIFKSTFAIGDVAAVTIVSMMPFGAFAEIVDGVDGLIHISQIAQTRISKPADVLELGQVVDAKIIDIDDEKQKVSLSIRALLEEAQAAAEAAPVEETEGSDAE